MKHSTRAKRSVNRTQLLPRLSSSYWLVEEKGWEAAKQTLHESLFTLGNGYQGSRGILEEIPQGAVPGTYFAGLYDNKNTQVTEMVNAPNPVLFKLWAGGEALDVSRLRVRSHYRALDMQQGMISRESVLSGKGGRRYRLESIRFFHLTNKHLAVMRVLVTPLDGPATFEVETYVDDQVTNQGIMTEGNKMHFITREKSRVGRINYLEDMTFEHRYCLAYATHLEIRQGKRQWTEAREQFRVSVSKGQTVCFTKLIATHSTRDQGTTLKNIKTRTLAEVRKAVCRGYDRVWSDHQRAWQTRWKAADVRLGCGGEPQRALRFNLYHLNILSNPADGQASIGARALSAEDYKGHVFWDTELFMLPFFIYTDPAAARALLLYRYHRLEAARAIAKGRGYAGSQFPWESADKGIEVTPSFTVDLDGRIVKTIIGEEEHIVADVGYAAWHYHHVTGDQRFLADYGLEILLETARFWVSRVKRNKRGQYEIKGVMGCDEFHANTNNNAFTNGLARFNILAALACLEELERSQAVAVRRLLERLGLERRRVQGWKRIALAIKRPPQRPDRVIEEFDGYFKLKHFPLPERKKYFLPGLPEKHVSVKDLRHTQYVKQGDTLILLYLLSEQFDLKTKKANYDFYDARTLHKSSLSPSIYAIVGAEVGDARKAYNYFLACLYTDIHNLYHNTARGIHSASLGATWQVVVNGFAGLRVYFDKLSFTPRVPPQVKSVSFTLKWRGRDLDVLAGQKLLTLLYHAGPGHTAAVEVDGQRLILPGGRTVKLKQDRRGRWWSSE